MAVCYLSISGKTQVSGHSYTSKRLTMSWHLILFTWAATITQKTSHCNRLLIEHASIGCDCCGIHLLELLMKNTSLGIYDNTLCVTKNNQVCKFIRKELKQFTLQVIALIYRTDSRDLGCYLELFINIYLMLLLPLLTLCDLSVK